MNVLLSVRQPMMHRVSSGVVNRPVDWCVQAAAPLFQQQIRTKFRKPDVHVYLKKAVRGLGEEGEIILSPLGLARNTLIPLGLAYYVPKWEGKPILPEGWKPRERVTQTELDIIMPADLSEEGALRLKNLLYSSSAKGGLRAIKHVAQDTLLSAGMAGFMDSLRALPALVFFKKCNESQKIYDSIGASDVVEMLQRLHKIRVSETDITLPKIRELGSFTASIQLVQDKPEGEAEPLTIPLSIQVVSE